MGVAVLQPQDCLFFSRKPLISPPRQKPPRNPNPNSNRANRTQPNRTKRSPSRSQNTSPTSRTMVAQSPAKNLVMGQVKILKRGEELAKTTPDPESEVIKITKNEGPDLGSTNRLGPDPNLVPKQVRLTEVNPAAGFYAGSAFIASPPPSSLPLPAFFTRKTVSVNNDDATTDLRRILGLDLP